jgi:hypothetical protein
MGVIPKTAMIAFFGSTLIALSFPAAAGRPGPLWPAQRRPGSCSCCSPRRMLRADEGPAVPKSEAEAKAAAETERLTACKSRRTVAQGTHLNDKSASPSGPPRREVRDETD